MEFVVVVVLLSPEHSSAFKLLLQIFYMKCLINPEDILHPHEAVQPCYLKYTDAHRTRQHSRQIAQLIMH